MKSNELRSEREYTLDAVKLLATIFIIFHHYQIYTGGVIYEKGINFNGGKFYFGYMVELFFVLSGYFVYRYVEKIKKGLSFKKYFATRYLRFLPMMSICAVAFAVACKVYEHYYGDVFTGHYITIWGVIVCQLGIQEGWVIKNPGINGVTWYISVLIWMYIVLFFVTWLSKKLKVSNVYFYVGVIMLGLSIYTYTYRLPFLTSQMARGYISFFTGIMVGELYSRKIIKSWMEIIAGLSAAVVLYLMLKGNFAAKSNENLLLMLLVWPSVLMFFKSKWVKCVLNWKIWGLLGEISYCAFMWHFICIVIMLDIDKAYSLNLNYACKTNMYIFCIICYILGGIMYRFVEIPLRNKVRNIVK